MHIHTQVALLLPFYEEIHVEGHYGIVTCILHVVLGSDKLAKSKIF